MPKSQPNNMSTFHPLQKLRHLLNRLDSNTQRRDQLIQDMLKAKREHELIIAGLQTSLRLIRDVRESLYEEGRELLPELKGFPRCEIKLSDLLRHT